MEAFYFSVTCLICLVNVGLSIYSKFGQEGTIFCPLWNIVHTFKSKTMLCKLFLFGIFFPVVSQSGRCTDCWTAGVSATADMTNKFLPVVWWS